MGPASERSIIWIKDQVGGQGKSQWSIYMQRKYPWVHLTTAGKRADILFSVQPHHKLIIFDIARSSVDFISHIYTIMENIKNSVFISTKYQPEQRVLDCIPHVVVMANEWPDLRKLSQDRWELFEILRSELVKVDAEALLKE